MLIRLHSADNTSGLTRPPPPSPGLTGVVPAASSGASSPPAALKHHSGPKTGGVLTESVRGQITDLQSGELTLKVLEGHPDRQTDRQTNRYFTVFILFFLTTVWTLAVQPTRTLRPPSYRAARLSPQSRWRSTLRSWYTDTNYIIHKHRPPVCQQSTLSCKTEELTCRSRLRSTPPDPRGFWSGSDAPADRGIPPAERKTNIQRMDPAASGPLVSVWCDGDSWAHLSDCGDRVGVAFNKLLEGHGLHVKGAGDLRTEQTVNTSHILSSYSSAVVVFITAVVFQYYCSSTVVICVCVCDWRLWSSPAVILSPELCWWYDEDLWELSSARTSPPHRP